MAQSKEITPEEFAHLKSVPPPLPQMPPPPPEMASITEEKLPTTQAELTSPVPVPPPVKKKHKPKKGAVSALRADTLEEQVSVGTVWVKIRLLSNARQLGLHHDLHRLPHR